MFLIKTDERMTILFEGSLYIGSVYALNIQKKKYTKIYEIFEDFIGWWFRR